MDRESQIAAQVAQRIPKEAPATDQPAPAVQEALKQAHQTIEKPTNYNTDIAALRLLDYFTVPVEMRRDREVLDKLNAIYDWGAEQAKSDDSVDVMTRIKELEGRLGLTFRDDKKLDSLYQWIKLDKERRRVEKEMSLI